MTKRFSILYVDDEVSNLKVFKNTFRRDYNIYTAESAKEGLEILEKEEIDLVLTDQRMPEMSGVEFLKKVMVNYPHLSRILITAYTDFDALKDAVNDAKIFQYIQKPWEEKDIQQIIDNALEIYQLRKKNIELTEKLNIQNKELIRLNKELVELDRLKIQFLNIISHEIRTPLNGLMGATEILKSELTEPEFLKYKNLFNILDVSAMRLNHFLLLAQRITEFKANSYEIRPEQFDVKTLIDKVIKSLQEKITKKNIKLECQFEDDKECKCYADEYLFKICLKEVIDNAIKYSDDSGRIVIKVSYRGDRAAIEIIDNGPGFPDIVLKNLFKIFITNEDITRQGMGLDLGLVHLIMKAHSGIIDIKNNETGGATVTLII